MFALERIRRRAALFAGVFLLAAVTAGMVAFLTGTVTDAADAGVRGALARQPEALRSFEVSIRADRSAAAPAVADAIALAFAGLPATVTPGIGDGERRTWSVRPEAEALRAADLSALTDAWASLGDTLTADRDTIGYVSLGGGFPRAAAEEQRFVRALGTSLPLGLLTLSVAAVATLWELAGLLARARRGEDRLLHDRGATIGGLAATAAIEAGLAALGGGVAGAALGILLAPRADPGTTALTLAVSVVTAAGAFALRSGLGMRAARSVRAARPAMAVVAVAAAALATWQLRTRGLVAGPDSAPAIDPLAVAAPALVLVATALVAVAVLPAATRPIERAIAAGDGPALAIRGVRRRIALAATPIVALALATGQLGFAAAYAATWHDSAVPVQQLRAGTALTATALAGGLDRDTIDAVVASPGVEGAAPVQEDALTVASIGGTASGIAPAALRALATTGEGAIDPAGLAEAIDVGSRMPPLPLTATRAGAVLTGEPDAASLWLADEWGSLVELPLHSRDGAWEAPLPSTPHPPWRVVAVDAQAGTGDAVVLRGLPTDAGEAALAPQWTGVAFHPWGDTRQEPAASPSIETGGVPGLVRLAVTPAAVPVVLSLPLARAVDASTGAELRISLPRAVSTTVTVAATAVAVPGAAEQQSALIDVRAAAALALVGGTSAPRPSTLWVDTADAGSTAASLRAVLPAGIAVATIDEDPTARMMATGPAVIWAAAGACVLMALAALAAGCAAHSALRRDEVATLAALGMRPADQAATRRRELWSVTGWGVLAGLAAAAVLAAAQVASLARAAVPGAYPDLPTIVHVDVAATAPALAVLAAGAVTIVVVHGARTARAARTAYGEAGR